jgi:hypothetical protein
MVELLHVKNEELSYKNISTCVVACIVFTYLHALATLCSLEMS